MSGGIKISLDTKKRKQTLMIVGRGLSTDGNRKGVGECVSGGIEVSLDIKKGKQTLMITGRGFVCGQKQKRKRQERERWDESIVRHPKRKTNLNNRGAGFRLRTEIEEK